ERCASRSAAQAPRRTSRRSSPPYRRRWTEPGQPGWPPGESAVTLESAQPRTVLGSSTMSRKPARLTPLLAAALVLVVAAGGVGFWLANRDTGPGEEFVTVHGNELRLEGERFRAAGSNS